MKISAYIPCFNNCKTIAQTLVSVRGQTQAVDELFVVDDGSSDGSAGLVESLGERVICLGSNLGRGAARARAMQEASHELVLCCDATAALPPDYLETALKRLAEPQVAAVFGRMVDTRTATAADRWRRRHLFRCDFQFELLKKAPLITTAALVRQSCCREAGGFNPLLRHSEDLDLGRRLLAAGWDVVFDPAMQITSTISNTLPEVLERYWRWNAGIEESASLAHYLKQIMFSFKVMAREDLKAGDPAAALVSLLSPHYQFWVSIWRKALGKTK